MNSKRILVATLLSALLLVGCSHKPATPESPTVPTVTDKAGDEGAAGTATGTPSPIQVAQLMSSDATTVRNSLTEAFGASAVQVGYGTNYDTFPTEEDKRILELKATGTLPVNGEERTCEITVSATGTGEFSSPDEFDQAWNDTSNTREIDLSWTTDEQDQEAAVENARTQAGLPEAEEKLDHGGLGIGLAGHCDANGSSVEWRIDTLADLDESGQPVTLLMITVG